ncbi:hypothetical protein [uncultured Mucilaginibacter sp.]|uniref:hypothetical protein n=1 Tax=uncultured Mucilaginibacter sp. TaxID=797541 RepID=UPI0025E3CA7D|nr:hypothetical protein [uncultured Mucilaginibacter sp.]
MNIKLTNDNMPAIVKNTNKGFGHGTVSSEIKNHDNDPFVVKKVQKAKETIQRVGFPGMKKK